MSVSSCCLAGLHDDCRDAPDGEGFFSWSGGIVAFVMLQQTPIGAAGLKALGPAVQYLAGQLSVEAGMLLPVLAMHNTVRMHFDIKEAEYLHLTKTDAAFPAEQFSMLADAARNEVRHCR